MDEKLKATIQKIQLLAKQNPEFETEMRNLFGSREVYAVDNKRNEERIRRIEKYLGLDYYVDDMNPVIDYSFIQEAEVRAQLISDCREMMRFRYGTRFHEILFEEFCRYAQLQAEMLLNYYYDKTNDKNIEDIKKHLLKFKSDILFRSNTETVSDIDFNNKFWAFVNEFALKQIINIFNNIRQVRNEMSHRSPNRDCFSVGDYQNKLRRLGIPLKNNGELSWGKIKQNNKIKSIVDALNQNDKDYKKYLFTIWYVDKPFDSIIEALNILKNTVSNQINKF